MENTKYTLHKSQDRGFSNHGWLRSAFSFSFSNWYEPTRMGFETLRVINDDTIDAQNGFGFHPHQDMEIVTIIFEGELTHQDTMGNKEVIKPGEVQRMSAGTGVLHSEMNDSQSEVKLFQIWIEPKEFGIKPSYEQKYFDSKKRFNTFQLLVSPDGRDDSLSINQEAYISRITLDGNSGPEYTKLGKDTSIYLMVVDGDVVVDSYELSSRDALGVKGKKTIELTSSSESDVIIFEIQNKKTN